MKIHRAVKAAAIKEQLEAALGIAGKTDIHGLEIQELPGLMEKVNFEERGKLVLDVCGDYRINRLAYHLPLKHWKNMAEAKTEDLASEEGSQMIHTVEEMAKEAGFVGWNLGVEEALLIVHIFGFAEKTSLEEHEQKLHLGEARLAELKKITDDYSNKYGLALTLVRENNPPDHGALVLGLLDYDPRETLRTAPSGISVNLDFTHLWQYLNYRAKGQGEFPGADLSKKIYSNFSLEEMAKAVAPFLKLIHLSDSAGYKINHHGEEIGRGDVPHQKLVPLICANLTQGVMGTYELINGHLDSPSVLRSDNQYRQLFGPKFKEYFE